MIKFQDFINERFVNLFGDVEGKEKYVDQVWDMLQSSYKRSGGIKGSGFGSKQEMIDKLPLWKLVRKDGKIVAGGLYKDKRGRKRVASFTDGTAQGKKWLAKVVEEDFERAFFEMSKAAFGSAVKNLGIDFMKRWAKTPQEVEKILKGKEIVYPVPENDPHVIKVPELKEFYYQRELGGKLETKIMLGTTGNKIVVEQ